jgi:hypothetical protein
MVRGGQPPGVLPDYLVDQGPTSRRVVLGDYREHGRTFPADGPMSVYSTPVSRSPGKVRPSRPTRGRSTGLEHCSIALSGVAKPGTVSVTAPFGVQWSMAIGRGDPPAEDQQ